MKKQADGLTLLLVGLRNGSWFPALAVLQEHGDAVFKQVLPPSPRAGGI